MWWKMKEEKKNKRNYFDNSLHHRCSGSRVNLDLMIAKEGKWNKRQNKWILKGKVLRQRWMNFFSVDPDDGTTPTLRQLYMAMRQIQFDLQDIKSQLNQEKTLRGDLQRLVMSHIEKCGSSTCWTNIIIEEVYETN